MIRDLKLAVRIARREMRGGLRGFRIFLACLTLGVAAIAAVGSVRESLQEGLATQGAVLLGGDATVSFTYRFADEAEAALLAKEAETLSIAADFRSMAVVGEDRGLTQVKAVDGHYPLYGTVTLDPPIALSQAFAGKEGLPGAVMDDLLMDRLGLAAGDEFALGGTPFVLMAELVNEPDNATGGFGLGPRTLVARENLEKVGMLSRGTLFDSEYRMRFRRVRILLQPRNG